MFWLAAELPPDIPPACVSQAAVHFAIPVEVIVAVGRQEGGTVGKVDVRSHGRYISRYQVSDKWLPTFSKWGYTEAMLTHNPCANVFAASYILAYYKAREPDWTRAIARYNVGSLDTPERIEAGTRYTKAVMKHWQDIYLKWKGQ